MTQVMRMSRKALTLGIVLTAVAWSMMAAMFLTPMKASAAGCTSGALIKGSLPAVYYCGADGKRYVFTNDKAYFTWYPSFAGVQVISDSDLAAIAIGGNVTYRPGVKMVKIQSDPKTYAIGHGGSLRWVQTEALAACLYGSNWNNQIDDISDAFFVNYQVGFAITSCADFNRIGEMNASTTINEDKGLTPVVNPPPPVNTPAVSSTSPVNGATNVLLDANVTATFNTAMNASTINTGTFTLVHGSTSVAGTVSFSGSTATFNPSANLLANTTYTARIGAAVHDLNGNSMTNDYVWSFSTGVSVSGSPTVISTSPGSAATNVSVNASVSATFDEAMNGSTLNTGTFLLAHGSTSVSGTVTYSGNTATFFPNASLLADTTYTATITTGARDANGNPLTSVYNWSFMTGPSPIVTSVSPTNGSTNVGLGATVSATFNVAMNASTINTGTFTLSTSSTSVSGSVSLSGNTATFYPNSNLAPSTMYTATITTGARDTNGNSLQNNYVWTFTTNP